MPPDWKPIETAPKSVEILVGAFYDSGHFDIALGRWNIALRRFPVVGQTGTPQFWMPRPDPPKTTT